jgi:hypothetical protein
MAAVTDSNDVSDIFWPGYVDAIANLAINLLFVIAIMAIVVIAATLQVQELLKRKDRALASDVAYVVLDQKDTQRGSGASEARSSTNAESSAMQRFAGGNSDRTSEQPNSALGERKSSAGASEQRTTTEPVTSTAVAPVQTRLQETLEARATVTEIDLASRVMTLRGPAGNEFTFEVDPAVRNLPQVKVGDDVVVRYFETIGAAMRKPGDSTEASIALADGVADPGDRPAAGIGTRTTLPVTIVSMDSKTNEVRFYGPDKRVRTVELETPEAQAFAKKLKAGDEVVVTFTEALAVSVEPAR